MQQTPELNPQPELQPNPETVKEPRRIVRTSINSADGNIYGAQKISEKDLSDRNNREQARISVEALRRVIERDGHCSQVEPDADVFISSDKASEKRALAICNLCVVQEACLEYALREKIDKGVWGNTTEGERKKLIRKYHKK